jgi:hypothetical protein
MTKIWLSSEDSQCAIPTTGMFPQVEQTFYNTAACLLKARIVKPAETAVARQREPQYIIPMATSQLTTTEEPWRQCFLCDPYRGHINVIVWRC